MSFKLHFVLPKLQNKLKMLLVYELSTYTIIISYYNAVNINLKSMSDNRDRSKFDR